MTSWERKVRRAQQHRAQGLAEKDGLAGPAVLPPEHREAEIAAGKNLLRQTRKERREGGRRWTQRAIKRLISRRTGER